MVTNYWFLTLCIIYPAFVAPWFPKSVYAEMLCAFQYIDWGEPERAPCSVEYGEFLLWEDDDV